VVVSESLGSAEPGATLALAVDPDRLHFFDPHTEEALTG
jgi:hypothetical protein